jgi:hypothetical protein
MAVKVMVAPAIARGEVASPAAPRSRGGAAPPKPKRRRSSVYDAEGNEVFITLMCLKCHKMRPLSLFGLRKMADGAIRNQPWCRSCRSTAVAEKPRRKGAVQEAEPVSPADASPAATTELVTETIRRPRSVAAEVAAALAAGMKR